MDFRSLNRFNIFINMFGGNFLPTTNKNTKLPVPLKIYTTLIWLIELANLIACIFGFFNVPREKVLKDGTVNVVISLEVIVLMIYLHSRKNLLRQLIGKLNHLLTVDDQMLGNITMSTVKPLKRPLEIYTVACVSSVVVWISCTIIKVFRKNEFYYTDYRVPIVISKEPFSVGVFISGVILQIFGNAYTIIRKTGLDVYTMHLILLITAQYKYLRIKFATVLQQKHGALSDFYDGAAWQIRSCQKEKIIKQEMRSLTRHYETVVEIAVILKKLLSPNIGLLYINNVFRFCFLSFMFLTGTTLYFEKCLVISYTIGALIQFYILCYCIQELLEASTAVADDVVYEKWYLYDVPFQRAISIIIFSNKLECKLSSFRNIDLTLPSFMSVSFYNEVLLRNFISLRNIEDVEKEID